MDLFETPLETLVLIHTSFDFLTRVSTFWTWVAVLTAAVSFWRIRACTGSQSSRKNWTADDKPQPLTSDPVILPACKTQSSYENSGSIPATKKILNSTLTEPVREKNPSTACVASLSGTKDCTLGRTAGSCHGSRKVKFSVCFEDDGVGKEGLAYLESWVDRGIDDVKPVHFIGKGYGTWERMLVPSRLDCSWYSSLDLTVLDGNVVRLWNGAGRRSPENQLSRRFT